MWYAVDILSGLVIDSSDGQRGRRYRCPRCRADVNFRGGPSRALHFAHNPGAGSELCELYTPGSGTGGGPDTATLARILPLQFFLGDDGVWQLFVEFTALDMDEWGAAVRSKYAASAVRLRNHSAGIDHGISPTDLWPGAGRNALPLPPSTDAAEAQTTGNWPNGVNRRRWAQTVPGMDGKGTIFARYRGGAFRRYEPQTTPVRWGDTVILLRNAKAFVPRELPAKSLPPLMMGDATWFAWQVTLPRNRSISAEGWLRSFGVTVEPPDFRPRIITPPHGYSADGVPVYPVGDEVAVLTGTEPAEALWEDFGQRHLVGFFAGNSMLALQTSRPVPSAFVSRKFGNPFVEITTKHVPAASAAPPPWSVMCGNHRLLSYDTIHMDTVPAVLRVSNHDVPLQVTVEIDSPQLGTETLLNADSATANEWIAERLDSATRVSIEAGNLGVITVQVETAPVITENPQSAADESAPRPRNWTAAYGRATAHSSTRSTPHWQIRDRTHSSPKTGRR